MGCVCVCVCVVFMCTAVPHFARRVTHMRPNEMIKMMLVTMRIVVTMVIVVVMRIW